MAVIYIYNELSKYLHTGWFYWFQSSRLGNWYQWIVLWLRNLLNRGKTTGSFIEFEESQDYELIASDVLLALGGTDEACINVFTSMLNTPSSEVNDNDVKIDCEIEANINEESDNGEFWMEDSWFI